MDWKQKLRWIDKGLIPNVAREWMLVRHGADGKKYLYDIPHLFY